MEVTREDVLRCARLADLRLGEDEVEPLRRDMARLLSQAQRLADLDQEALDPAIPDGTPALPRREDVPGPCLAQAEALANAPAQERGHFLVPKVL